MNRLIRHSVIPLLAIPAVLVSSCATILGGGTTQPVSVVSEPAGATFTVKSSTGLQMASGKTPQTITLPRKNEYQVEFSAPGYQTQSVALVKGINGWTWGNLVFGWIIGFAVDFLSGSAYKLEPSSVQISLVKQADEQGAIQLFGVVRQLDAGGRVLAEQRVLLQPVR